LRIREEANGSLVLTYDSTRLSTVLFVLTAVLIAAAGRQRFLGAGDSERVIGLLGGAATLLLSGIALREQARAVVNPVARAIVWKRQWAFRTRSGSLSFADVAAVLPERPIGDEGVPSRRIVLRTNAGQTIPLTAGYRPDGDGAILAASERIAAMVARGAASPPLAGVEALAASGRVIDAIKLLREREGLSLDEAKRRVDALRPKHE
jgi:hypothetical protein